MAKAKPTTGTKSDTPQDISDFYSMQTENYLEEEKGRVEPQNKPVRAAKQTKAKKMGRPSDKIPGVEYTTFGVTIQKETHKRMRVALATTFEGVFKTQEGFIDAAIREKLERGI